MVPSEWKDILSKVQGAFPGAIIAGGALRDLELGGNVKDVDIFIPITDKRDIENKVWEMFPDAELSVSTTYGVNTPESKEDRDLYALFKLMGLRYSYVYELIFCSPETCDIDKFDINICQVMFDGTTRISSNAYDDGLETKTIKVMNVNRTDRNKARLERVSAKYPDFKTEETVHERL